MARFLDLADELIVQIISYFKPQPPILSDRPFHCWPKTLERQNVSAFAQTKDLKSVAICCKRLQSLLTPTLYNYLPLIESGYHNHQIPSLLKSLENHPGLTANITCINVEGISALHFHHFFWLPNIHTLSIKDYNSWGALEWESTSHVGTSPVKILRLARCGAREAPLTELLSWPRSLKELWYDANQGEWDGHYGGQDAVEFSCATVARAMSSQKSSVEKLVFSRPVQDHEGLGYGDVMDFRDFGKLRSLCVNQVFLTGWDQNSSVWERLPASLVELEVFYDDSGYVNFLEGDAERPGWLFGVLRNKREYTPRLERVRIVALEWWEEDHTEEQPMNGEHIAEQGGQSETQTEIEGSASVDFDWAPPIELVNAFAQAGVSFSVFLHQNRRAISVVKGGKGFEDVWEDLWTADMEE